MAKHLSPDFIKRLQRQRTDAEAFVSAIDTAPYYSVRFNMRKCQGDTYCLTGTTSPVSWCNDAYYIDQRPKYTLNPLFHAGCFYPQEASSMYVAHAMNHIADLLPEEPIILDLCAAPGGKSTLLASWLDGRGILVANEAVRSRAWILRENIVKWGYDNCIVTNCDPKQIGDAGAMYDVLLVDAPCSGEGMFRKDDTAVEEWSVENANLCAQRQRRILMDVWDSLVEDGIMIYSTCTFNPAENEENMAWLAQQTEIEFIDIPIPDNSGIEALPINDGEGHGYAFYPHKVKGEGFFICVVRKLSGKNRKKDKNKTKIRKASIPSGILRDNNYTVILSEADNKVIALPKEKASTMQSIMSRHKALYAGIEVGEETKKEFIPSAEAALSLALNTEHFNQIETTEHEALNYLHGTWTAPTDNIGKGWSLVTYHNQPLGFIKAIGNRVNNYYPKEWRIRMNID